VRLPALIDDDELTLDVFCEHVARGRRHLARGLTDGNDVDAEIQHARRTKLRFDQVSKSSSLDHASLIARASFTSSFVTPTCIRARSLSGLSESYGSSSAPKVVKVGYVDGANTSRAIKSWRDWPCRHVASNPMARLARPAKAVAVSAAHRCTPV